MTHTHTQTMEGRMKNYRVKKTDKSNRRREEITRTRFQSGKMGTSRKLEKMG